MNGQETNPEYEVGRSLEEYRTILPKWKGEDVVALIDKLLGQQAVVKIVDLGAGEFMFAEDCHRRENWQGKVQVSGVSLHRFIDDQRQAYLESLGVACYFIPTAQAPSVLSADYDLVTSVFTDIHDLQTNYPDMAWSILKNGGIALIDNIKGQMPWKEWQALEAVLKGQGYPVDISRQQTTSTPPPQSNVYVQEYTKLLKEFPDYKQQPYVLKVGASLSFQKDSSKTSLGQRIQELIENGK